MSPSKQTQKALSESAMMLPLEQLQAVGRNKKQLYIGLPKEVSMQENRVALVPEAVQLLVNNGHRVVVEKDAGKASNFSDTEYSEAGAEIAYSTEAVYEADLILKVEPISDEEMEFLKPKQVLISAMQLNVQPKNYIKNLMAKRVTAIAWDYIADEDGILPIVRSMGEIAGTTSILIAAEYLSNLKGQGIMLGGITGVAPTQVAIIGAGTVGEYATRAALGLGADVRVFDNSITRLRRLQNSIGQRVSTSTIQPKILAKALMRADVVIGAVRSTSGRTPCYVSEEMVRNMKPSSVIVDVSIDQGGCFETSRITTHDNPSYVVHDVIHYCVPNIASRASRTASHALSNVMTPIAMHVSEEGGIENTIRNHRGIQNGVYLYNGTLTNRYLGESLKLPFKDLKLLLAAF
ncbi:alanine dehydrogenase [Salibacteraceae bacterium]|jgi:alanine dehydrogenase|nr:alanine dehydrogenase [Flavobacteriales bacterium]MDB9701663.1 alanine dehydrogenase [Salibacteraceae bacterium]